jgi:RND family efflux transporter MFP subunit
MKKLTKTMRNPKAFQIIRGWRGGARVQLLSAATMAIAIGGLLAGCGKPEGTHRKSQVELPKASVRVAAANNKTEPLVEEVVGTVQAKVRARIDSKVSGRIKELPVVLGQKVQAGQLIAGLEAAEIKARLEQAEAALQQSERDWQRVEALFNQQATTRSERDAAESRYLMAKAAVAEARALTAYTQVMAPFDGVVTYKWAQAGDLAMPGKPIVDLEDASRLQLEADLPEAIVGRVQPGAQMAVRSDALAGEIAGTVVEMAPSADPVSRTFKVKLDLPGSPGLKPGQFARLVVPVGESSSLRVPLAAVVQRGQMEMVFVVENQQARLHLVKTGRRSEQHAEILSGLDSGDAVVIEGALRLVDGQPVEVQ